MTEAAEDLYKVFFRDLEIEEFDVDACGFLSHELRPTSLFYDAIRGHPGPARDKVKSLLIASSLTAFLG